MKSLRDDSYVVKVRVFLDEMKSEKMEKLRKFHTKIQVSYKAGFPSSQDNH